MKYLLQWKLGDGTQEIAQRKAWDMAAGAQAVERVVKTLGSRAVYLGGNSVLTLTFIFSLSQFAHLYNGHTN